MALLCIPVPGLVSCTFSTIPICPFEYFHLLVILYATPNSQPKSMNDTSPILYRLVSLICLGWELLCMAYNIITVLHVCVKAISILSASCASPILHFEFLV